MSLLDGLVGQVIKNSLGGQQQQPQNQDVLGGLLGSVLGGQNQAQSQQGGLGGLLGSVVASQLGGQSQQSQGGLGGLLGSVVASQLGGGQSQANSGLGGVLGSLLGGQMGGQKQSVPAGDLGGLLGQVVSSQLGNRSGGGLNKNTLLLALIPVVLAFIQKNGGLSGVLNKFNGAGLDNKAQSWVALDQDNDGLDAGDVMRLFDNDDINNVCQQTGASQGEVCQGIAELLPQVMNDLTPNGSVGADETVANNEISELLAAFAKAKA